MVRTTPCNGKNNPLQCKGLNDKEARVKTRGLFYDPQREVLFLFFDDGLGWLEDFYSAFLGEYFCLEFCGLAWL
jgi:hypothetical protein